MNIIEKIFHAGIVGAGGAGFPTYKKLVTDTKWLIVNAAECEPLLQSDIYLCENSAGDIIDALDLLQKEFHFEHVVIGIKKKHPHAIAELEKAIAERNSNVTIHTLQNFYPAGDEQILVYEVTGETVPPAGIPLQVGVVVMNNTTVYNIYHAIMKDTPVTRKIVTVTGEVNRPILVDVPIGTSVAECIQLAGGSTLEDYFFIMGGVMMGSQHDASESGSIYITKASGGIIVLPKDHYLKTFLSKTPARITNETRSACIQCSFCTDMCPRYLIGHQMRPHLVMRSLGTNTHSELSTDAFHCCECGICELYACPMGLSPRQVNIRMKKELREEGITEGDRTIHLEHTDAYPYRKIPQPRIIHRLQLTPYTKHIDEFVTHDPNQVTIAYKHGIGKNATAVVAVGDTVSKGQLIASIEMGEMGSNIHASINGKVTSIDGNIVIEKQ